MNWLLLRPVRRFVKQAALASLLLNLVLITPSLYMLEVFDRVFTSRSTETLAMLTGFAVLALLLGACLDRARAVLLARAGRIVDEALSPQALAATLVDAARGRAGADRHSLLDIGRLRAFCASPALHALFDAPWLPVYLAVIYALHPLLGVAATTAAVLLFALGFVTERRTRTVTERSLGAGRAASAHTDALLRNAEVLLGMGMLAPALRGWRRLYDATLAQQQALGDASAGLAALGRLLRQLVQVAMLGLGAGLVVGGDASPGIMVAATVLIARALQPVELLISGWKSLVEVRGAWARLQQRQVEAPEAPAATLPPVRGEVGLERVVYFADRERAALVKGVSLQLKAGECLGLIGASGSGKTTLLRLLLGLRLPSSGCVRLDGIEIGAWPRERLAGCVGYLPQDVELFAGSVAHNIARLADAPADADAVLDAARRAGVHEMIARLPKAYETEIGEGGCALSGGQRQRIGLARALYGAPRLVVLDEPNAHLDAEGESALMTAIESLKAAGATVVLVSHRPSLMRQADRLAVLREGALELLGPRDQVLARLAQPALQGVGPGSRASAGDGARTTIHSATSPPSVASSTASADAAHRADIGSAASGIPPAAPVARQSREACA